MSKIPEVPCHIKELNISCFGCCGNKFSSKDEILEDIRLNSGELKEIGGESPSNDSLKTFRDRFGGDNALSLNGLCYNAVDLGEGCVGCPLHPLIDRIMPEKRNFNIQNKEDLRIGHCDINEECKTFKMWREISDSDKIQFVEWLKKNKYDTYSYSVENGREELFEKFKNS